MRLSKIICWFLAYVSVIGISHMQVQNESLPMLSNSVFSIFIWIAFGNFFIKIFPGAGRRILIVSMILGATFSAFMVIGANIFSNNTTALDSSRTWGFIIAGTPFFAAVVILLFRWIPKLNRIAPVKWLSKFEKLLSIRKYFLISWAAIFLAWVPALLAQYPGIFAYDSIGQIEFYRRFDDNPWTRFDFSAPFIHSFFMGFCTVTLGNLLGSFERGFLIYTLTQMVCVSAVFAAVSAYMKARRLSELLRIIWQAYFMFFPLNPIMALSATKDIFYGAFLCLFVLMTFIMAERSTSEVLKWRPAFFLAAVIAGFMSIIFRSQGPHVFVFGVVFGLLIMKGQRILVFKMAAASLALFAVYMGVLTGVFNGYNEVYFALRETMSVPAVQMSRVAVFRRNELPPKDLDEIKKYFPDCELYEIKPLQGTSDHVRASFNSHLFYDNPKTFVQLYLNLAARYPMDYIDAFARLTVGEWYPDLRFLTYHDGQPYFQYESFQRDSENWISLVKKYDGSEYNIGRLFQVNDDTIIIKNATVKGFNWLHRFYGKIAYKYTYERAPVISMLFSTGFIFWIILTYVFWCLYSRKYRMLFPASFLIGLWLTMVLGPISLYRYTFPLAIAVPILTTFMITESEQDDR